LHVDNWAETPQSIEMKKTLDPDIILHEGDRAVPTHRLHLARQWIAPNVTLDPFLPRTPQEPEEVDENPSNLYDPTSPAYIGNQTPLDAVGGVATLVRASVHLFGGVFPSWNLDHAVETEGFGLLAKLVGARVVGLPNYLVIHR
jgi:mannan polymerase complexes MNN9 subunit